MRVDSGVQEGGEVSPMYDPMVAKLIVWDADREQATRRMLRALCEYEIGELKTLIPFHQALLATEQWARGETCRDLLEDKQWLKALAFPAATPASADGEEEAEKVEQTYAVEVSGKRFDVRVIGPPFAGGAGAPAAAMNGSSAGAGARKAPKRGERKSSSGGGPDTLPSPLQGNMWKVLVKQGDDGAGGPAAVHHRGDEDGERDHRAQGGHDRRAADHRGRPDPGRRADRDDHLRRSSRLARPSGRGGVSAIAPMMRHGLCASALTFSA